MTAIHVSTAHFSGLRNVHGTNTTSLSNIVRGISQDLALYALSTVTDLTDNSTGATPVGTISAIPIPAPHTLSGTDAAQKAATDSALATVNQALIDLADQLVTIKAKVPATSAINSMGGTPSTTIAAVTKTVSGVGTSCVDAPAGIACLTAMVNTVAELAVEVNKVAVACNQTPVVDHSGGVKAYTGVFAALTATTGTATSGAALSTLAATAVSATLTGLANAVAELAAKLNACTAVSGFALRNVVAA